MNLDKLLALLDSELYFFLDDQDRVLDSDFCADDDAAMAHAATLAAHTEVFVARFVGSVEPVRAQPPRLVDEPDEDGLFAPLVPDEFWTQEPPRE